MTEEMQFEPAKRIWTAEGLIKLLRARHSEDVFLAECKDGPSAGMSHYRLDGWAMQKSWSRPTTFGYECKVTRADFLRDDKWQHYLTLCSDFYFVCPWGMIQPAEVGDGAGLLWASKEGERLWEKKKAPRRQVEIPETLWRYIVMRLDNPRWETTAEKWARWLADEKASLVCGHNAGKKLRKMISEQVDKAFCENERLRKENESLASIKEMLDELKIYPHGYRVKDQLRQQLERIQQAIPQELIRELERVVEHANEVLKEVKFEKSSSLS